MVARHLPPAARFVNFVAEREAIRVRRAAGQAAPWTDDEILRTYRFTNVRRRDDRVSLWLREHIYRSALFSEPSLTALQIVALCRWINWPPTIAVLGEAGLLRGEGHLDLRAVGRLIDRQTKLGKAWTGAYMVRAAPESRPKGGFVAEQVVGRSLRRAWPELQFMLQTGMRRPVWRVLTECLHWGSFMAGQVVDDLTWTPLLAAPRDDLTWAPVGPGSRRGLNRILGLSLGAQHEELAWCGHLVRLRGMVVERLGPDYADLTLMDVQNCCCEFDKHERVRLGQGRPRAVYRPETSF
jgi:hypothetical protein